MLTHLVAELVTSKRVETDQLCVGDVCVTRDQLKELLDKNQIGADMASQNADTGSSTEQNLRTESISTESSSSTAKEASQNQQSAEPENTSPIAPGIIEDSSSF